jgi:hypothetical protein
MEQFLLRKTVFMAPLSAAIKLLQHEIRFFMATWIFCMDRTTLDWVYREAENPSFPP